MQHVVDGLVGYPAELLPYGSDDPVSVGVRLIVHDRQHREPRTGHAQAGPAQHALVVRRRRHTWKPGPTSGVDQPSRASTLDLCTVGPSRQRHPNGCAGMGSTTSRVRANRGRAVARQRLRDLTPDPRPGGTEPRPHERCTETPSNGVPGRPVLLHDDRIPAAGQPRGSYHWCPRGDTLHTHTPIGLITAVAGENPDRAVVPGGAGELRRRRSAARRKGIQLPGLRHPDDRVDRVADVASPSGSWRTVHRPGMLCRWRRRCVRRWSVGARRSTC